MQNKLTELTKVSFEFLSRVGIMGFILLYSLSLFPMIRHICLGAFLLINFYPSLNNLVRGKSISITKDWESIIAGIALIIIAFHLIKIAFWILIGIIILAIIIYFLRKRKS